MDLGFEIWPSPPSNTPPLDGRYQRGAGRRGARSTVAVSHDGGVRVYLSACALSIQDAVARGCRRVWPLNYHQWRCDDSIGDRRSRSIEAAAVACDECEDVPKTKLTPVVEESGAKDKPPLKKLPHGGCF